jgi:hypothetical protein
VLRGDVYSADNPEPGNPTLSKLNLATGAAAQGPVHSNAFGSMVSREPEGMAGYVKADGEHRLYFGLVGHSGRPRPPSPTASTGPSASRTRTSSPDLEVGPAGVRSA